MIGSKSEKLGAQSALVPSKLTAAPVSFQKPWNKLHYSFNNREESPCSFILDEQLGIQMLLQFYKLSILFSSLLLDYCITVCQPFSILSNTAIYRQLYVNIIQFPPISVKVELVKGAMKRLPFFFIYSSTK